MQNKGICLLDIFYEPSNIALQSPPVSCSFWDLRLLSPGLCSKALSTEARSRSARSVSVRYIRRLRSFSSCMPRQALSDMGANVSPSLGLHRLSISDQEPQKSMPPGRRENTPTWNCACEAHTRIFLSPKPEDWLCMSNVLSAAPARGVLPPGILLRLETLEMTARFSGQVTCKISAVQQLSAKTDLWIDLTQIKWDRDNGNSPFPHSVDKAVFLIDKANCFFSTELVFITMPVHFLSVKQGSSRIFCSVMKRWPI